MLQHLLEIAPWDALALGDVAALHRAGQAVMGDVDDGVDGVEQLLGDAHHGPRPARATKPVEPKPVEPNPPAPRPLSDRVSASSQATRVTGAITIWAMRSPRAMANGACPRLTRIRQAETTSE